jgi:hypothetical protein
MLISSDMDRPSRKEGWRVRVFENGRPATGVIYTVSHETATDAMPANIVEGLRKRAELTPSRCGIGYYMSEAKGHSVGADH